MHYILSMPFIHTLHHSLILISHIPPPLLTYPSIPPFSNAVFRSRGDRDGGWDPATADQGPGQQDKGAYCMSYILDFALWHAGNITYTCFWSLVTLYSFFPTSILNVYLLIYSRLFMYICVCIQAKIFEPTQEGARKVVIGQYKMFIHVVYICGICICLYELCHICFILFALCAISTHMCM